MHHIIHMCGKLDESRSKRQVDFKPQKKRLRLAEEAMVQSPLEEKHRIMDNIRAELNSFDTEETYRTANQRRIQMGYLTSAIPLVYGSLMRTNEQAIREYNHIRTGAIAPFRFTAIPRRGGKTESLGQFLAAATKHIIDPEVLIFSAAARTAGKNSGVLGCVIKYLQKLGITHFEVTNGEELFFRFNDNVKKIRAMPAGTHTYGTSIVSASSSSSSIFLGLLLGTFFLHTHSLAFFGTLSLFFDTLFVFGTYVTNYILNAGCTTKSKRAPGCASRVATPTMYSNKLLLLARKNTLACEIICVNWGVAIICLRASSL